MACPTAGQRWRPLPRASHALTPTHCPLWPPVSSPIIITTTIINTIAITMFTMINTTHHCSIS